MRPLIAALGLALLTAPATASTPAAWRQLEREAKLSCTKASSFARPTVSNMIIFEDATGMVAFLVSGKHREAHMKGAIGTNLCLYNRQTKKAAVEEAVGWSARR